MTLEKALFQLNFTTRVLGPPAAGNLAHHKVEQTIRSPNSGIALELESIDKALKLGDSIAINLDGKCVGWGKLKEVGRIKWQNLTQQDAERGGFSHIIDLRQALLRAGYRFQPLEEYQLYRIRFEWI